MGSCDRQQGGKCGRKSQQEKVLFSFFLWLLMIKEFISPDFQRKIRKGTILCHWPTQSFPLFPFPNLFLFSRARWATAQACSLWVFSVAFLELSYARWSSYCVTAFELQWQNWAVAIRPNGPQSLKYLLPGSLRKRLLTPAFIQLATHCNVLLCVLYVCMPFSFLFHGFIWTPAYSCKIHSIVSY